MKNKRNQVILFAVFLMIAAIISISKNYSKIKEEDMITYDKVVTYVKNGDIVKVIATQEKNQITVILSDGTEKKSVIPSMDEFTSLISKQIDNGSEIEFKIQATTINVKVLVPTIILIVFIIEFTIATGKIGNMGHRNKTVKSDTTFQDVAGIDAEREQLEEIVRFLKNPNDYTSIGATIPKGVLLYGDPGTGKTLLAKAIAGEAGIPFLQADASSFEERFIGVGASRVRNLFKQAKKIAPCIIFIDELDAVAQSRYNGKSDSEQTLNQLLAEMDGFSSFDNVIVIAATNHMEVLDPAILRPGRFDRHVYISKPDVMARKKILEIHARNKRFAGDVSLEEIAKKTIGFSGADLKNVLNEAAIYAVNQGKNCIFATDIDEATARVLVGLEKKNSVITDTDKKLTAVHESGHAIISAILRPTIKNLGISIIQRGNAGGYNFFTETDLKYSRKEYLENQICVMYGGRIAEQVILEDISSSAADDLEKASQIAYLMVTKFAMNGNLLVKIGNESDYNEQLDAQKIKEAEEICQKSYEITKKLVTTHQDAIVKLSDLLYEKEYLSEEEIEIFLTENLK